MRLLTFSGRNTKEILRDPLTSAFGLGFPIVLILLLSALQANIPVSLFELESLTPGITIFGLSFMTLFSATLIAKDRESTFLQRLYTSPLTAADFIFGYALPILPMAVAQCILCYVVALILGLSATVNILYAVLFILPAAVCTRRGTGTRRALRQFGGYSPAPLLGAGLRRGSIRCRYPGISGKEIFLNRFPKRTFPNCKFF